MKPGRSARRIARPVWSGPRLKRKVAPAPWRLSISSRRGTPSRVPRKVSTSILRARLRKAALVCGKNHIPASVAALNRARKSNRAGCENARMQPAERNSRTPYELIGGDAKVRELVDRFYDLMDFEPAYRQLRAVHGNTLESAREKLHHFLSGWL